MSIHKILAPILAAICTIAAYPQQHYSANIAVGVKGGATLSQTMFSPGIEQAFITGMLGGVTFRYIEEQHFGLIAEVNMEQRGWKETFDETQYSFQRKLTYLQIPLLAHIYFGSDVTKFFFNAGPEIGFMISDKCSANFNYHDLAGLPSDFPIENRNTEQFTMDIKNKIDYGISAGLGMELVAKRKHSIMLEGRFYYGLNKIFSSRKRDTFAASNGMSIMVTLGYMFRIK